MDYMVRSKSTSTLFEESYDRLKATYKKQLPTVGTYDIERGEKYLSKQGNKGITFDKNFEKRKPVHASESPKKIYDVERGERYLEKSGKKGITFDKNIEKAKP